MKHHVAIKMSGKFDLMVKHADGTHDIYEAPNLIVNQGKDIYGGLAPTGGYTASMGGVAVGTGNTAPLATDVTLVAPLAATATFGTNTESAPSLVAPYSQMASAVFTFGVGAVVGNIAEIGMTIGGIAIAAGNKLFSRALILVGGLPGVITLTATDQLLVTYTLTQTYAADTTGSMNVTTNGVPVAINYTVRPMQLGVNGGANQITHYIGKLATTGWNIYAASNVAFVATNTSLTSANAGPFLSQTAYVAGTFTQSFTYNWVTGAPFSRTMFGIAVSGMINFQILFASDFGPLTTQAMQMQITYSWV